VADRAALQAVLAPAFLHRRKEELLAAFAAAGVPAGPINNVAEVFADPQVVARGLGIERDGVPGVASPIVIDRARQVAEARSPRLDEHDGDGASLW
jgi:crotonobetainyl-CoA:carnitine CoA-transferase CaiB-like acyl-CoA transferase